MSADLQRPPDAELETVPNGGLNASVAPINPPSDTNLRPDINLPSDINPSSQAPLNLLTLAQLPIGAHLILRCRKDWRDATIIAISLEREQVTLSVGAPSGRTYRLRRPSTSPLSLDGSIPILGQGTWRSNLARYDTRW